MERQYVAVVDAVPADLLHTLVERGWEVTVAPRQITVAKLDRLSDHDALRGELTDLLAGSEPSPNILWDAAPRPEPARLAAEEGWFDLPRETQMTLAQTDPALVGTLRVPWRYAGTTTDDAADRATNDDAKAPEKSVAAPVQATSELAALLEKGLAALEIPDGVWGRLGRDDVAGLAKATTESLYAARVELARRVGWVLAPELELLEFVDRQPKDPQSTATKGLAKELLQARVDKSKAGADLVGMDVELKRELLRQQAKVTQLLDEFIKHAIAWRGLAQTGKRFLIGLTLFATAVVGFLAFLLWDEKLDVWAFPAAVFVLALFAISPAVLLIIERPLKGIDQWMPSGKAEDDEKTEKNGSEAPE